LAHRVGLTDVGDVQCTEFSESITAVYSLTVSCNLIIEFIIQLQITMLLLLLLMMMMRMRSKTTGGSRKIAHEVCHVINFEPFVLGQRCLHQNVQQRLLLTD